MLHIKYPVTLERRVTVYYDDGSRPELDELKACHIRFNDARFIRPMSGWDADGRRLLDLIGFEHGQLLQYCAHCGHERPLAQTLGVHPRHAGFFRR